VVHKEVIEWICPPNDEPTYYQDRYKELLEDRCKDTCDWIFSEDAFQLWLLPETPDNILWFYGDLGSGKSTLAATIVEMLLTRSSKNEVVLYFFVDSASNNAEKYTPVAVIRSLVFQATTTVTRTASKLMLVEKGKENSNTRVSMRFDDLWELLVAILCLMDFTYIIIDGVDECSDARLLVSHIIQLNSTVAHPIKVLLTSRVTGEPVLTQILDGYSSIKISPSKTAVDMDRFLSVELDRLSEEIQIALPSQALERVRTILDSKSDGMYIFLLFHPFFCLPVPQLTS